MGRLDGKTCLVTAAGQGIGRASALAMAAEGARVIATDINEATLAELAEAGLETRVLDVLDPAEIAAAAEAAGTMDVLFNCAGYVQHGTHPGLRRGRTGTFPSTSTSRRMYRMIRAFLPAMIERGGGSIINMSSVASSIIAAPNRFVYGATKAAVIGMTKAVAADFITQGIRCNAICPGTVESPSLEDRLRRPATTTRPAPPSSRASPWAGSASPRRSPHWWSISPRTRAPTPPAQPIVIDGGWANT